MTLAIGLDFGTTNSALAVRTADGAVRLARFSSLAGPTETFRSILHVYKEEDGEVRVPAGARAMETYLESDSPGRLIQSLKTFLTSKSFTETAIYGRLYTLEVLIAAILRGVREECGVDVAASDTRVVVGRPVRFAGSSGEEDDSHAEGRLREALSLAGFERVTFELEPVAAAYEYQRRLEEPELTLIADFGGGTTDFSLLEMEPAREAAPRVHVLACSGVGIAGDVFDARIVSRVLAPELGSESAYTSTLGKTLPIPRWIYGHLERWHLVPLLASKENLSQIRTIARRADEPEKLAAVLAIVERNLGFELHQAVHACKLGLTTGDEARFTWHAPELSVDERVSRPEFESWIAEDLAAIEESLEEVLRQASVATADVGSVFLTGGTSLVPAVRRLFTDRFGEERVRGGEELTSVASGLALRAATSA